MKEILNLVRKRSRETIALFNISSLSFIIIFIGLSAGVFHHNIPSASAWNGNEYENTTLNHDEKFDDEGIKSEDGYSSSCTNETITISASKIICDNESSLPNWGLVGPDISKDTAQEYVQAHEGCHLAKGWSFQWGNQDLVNPGDDFYGEAGTGWTTFGPTNEDGSVETVASLSGVSKFKLREVLKEGYIPFTYFPDKKNDDNVSAEFYCSEDVENYDNFDFIENPQNGGKYYCIAFNSPVITPVTQTLTVNKVIVPSEDPGKFNLLIDGEIMATDVSNGGTTGPKEASVGAHTISEIAGSGTELSEYAATFGGDCDSSGNITIISGQNAICTITNTKKTNTNIATLVVSKIICDKESLLPNWGEDGIQAGEPETFTSATAEEYVATHEGCHLAEGWSFQRGDQDVLNPGDDFYGEAENGWTTFGQTNASGTFETTVDLSGISMLKFREVLKEGYIPFTYFPDKKNDDNVSAEFYCGSDIENYDNYDFIENPVAGEKYYCIAFNAAIETPQLPQCSDGTDNDGDTFIDASDPGCHSDGNANNSESYDPNDNDETDNVPPPTVYQCSDGIDNDQDGLIDSSDPGCHTDGNANNLQSYDPNDNDETNAPTPTVYQCSDGTDNDGDTFIDSSDPTCHSDSNPSNVGSYLPNRNYEKNNIPLITLAKSEISIFVGVNFDPYAGYATASDYEDGNITNKIKATGAVNTNSAGSYNVNYDVVDSENAAAETKTLHVSVIQQGCLTNCGGGGGGGGNPIIVKPTITITNEKVVYLGEGKAKVTWKTNIETTEQVVYGDNSIKTLGIPPKYGYDSMTTESSTMKIDHSVVVSGLTDGITYYFRPVADRSGSTGEVVGKEVFYAIEKGEVKGETAPPPADCNYLLEYIKLGRNNNPVEVKKLEQFLNQFEGENLPVNGIYEQRDFDAVSRFQKKYTADVLTPWGYIKPTGYVYITTKKKINEVYCKREFPLTISQKSEIESFFRRFLGIGKSSSTKTAGGEAVPTSAEFEEQGKGGIADGSTSLENETTEDETTEDGTTEDGTSENIEEKVVPEEQQQTGDKITESKDSTASQSKEKNGDNGNLTPSLYTIAIIIVAVIVLVGLLYLAYKFNKKDYI